MHAPLIFHRPVNTSGRSTDKSDIRIEQEDRNSKRQIIAKRAARRTLRITGVVLAVVLLYLIINPVMNAESKTITLGLRNVSYPVDNPPGDIINDQFRIRTRDISLDVEDAALILIDVWDTFQERHRIDSSIGKLIKTKIAPLLKAARKAEMLVIHAAHRPVGWDGVNKEPELDLRSPWSGGFISVPQDVKESMKGKDVWPPLEFIFRVNEFRPYARNDRPAYLSYPKVLGINKAALPRKRPKEFIESDEGNVFSLLKRFKIKHLFYAGGAADQCILARPVGIRRMAARGFNIILLRDAVYATSYYDEAGKGHSLLKPAIKEVEIQHGFSALSTDLIEVLNQR